MARGDRRLQRVRAQRATEALRALERGEAAADQQPVPARAVLVREEDRLPRRPDPRPQPRRLDLHQGNEAVDLRLPRCELGEDPPSRSASSHSPGRVQSSPPVAE